MSSLTPASPPVVPVAHFSAGISVKRKPKAGLPLPVPVPVSSSKEDGIKKRKIYVISEQERNINEARDILKGIYRVNDDTLLSADIYALLSLDRALKLCSLPALLEAELLLAKGQLCFVVKYTQRALFTFQKGLDVLQEKGSSEAKSLKRRLCEKKAMTYRELLGTVTGIRESYYRRALGVLEFGMQFCVSQEEKGELFYEKVLIFEAIGTSQKSMEVIQIALSDYPEMSDELRSDFMLLEFEIAKSLVLPDAQLLKIIEKALQFGGLSKEVKDIFLEDRNSIVVSMYHNRSK